MSRPGPPALGDPCALLVAGSTPGAVEGVAAVLAAGGATRVSDDDGDATQRLDDALARGAPVLLAGPDVEARLGSWTERLRRRGVRRAFVLAVEDPARLEGDGAARDRAWLDWAAAAIAAERASRGGRRVVVDLARAADDPAATLDRVARRLAAPLRAGGAVAAPAAATGGGRAREADPAFAPVRRLWAALQAAAVDAPENEDVVAEVDAWLAEQARFASAREVGSAAEVQAARARAAQAEAEALTLRRDRDDRPERLAAAEATARAAAARAAALAAALDAARREASDWKARGEAERVEVRAEARQAREALGVALAVRDRALADAAEAARGAVQVRAAAEGLLAQAQAWHGEVQADLRDRLALSLVGEDGARARVRMLSTQLAEARAELDGRGLRGWARRLLGR